MSTQNTIGAPPPCPCQPRTSYMRSAMESLSRCIWYVNVERRTDGDEIGADMLHVMSKTRLKQDVRLCARVGACVRLTRLTYPPLLHVCAGHYRGHKVAATTTSKAGAIVVVCPLTAELFLLHPDLAEYPYSRGHLAAVKGIQTGLQVCGAHHAATRSDSKSMHLSLLTLYTRFDKMKNRGGLPWGGCFNSCDNVGDGKPNCYIRWIRSPHLKKYSNKEIGFDNDTEGFLFTLRPIKAGEKLSWKYSITQGYRYAPNAVDVVVPARGAVLKRQVCNSARCFLLPHAAACLLLAAAAYCCLCLLPLAVAVSCAMCDA